MTTDPALEIFLHKWRAALNERSNPLRLFWWEGQKACAELKHTGYMDRVRLEEKSQDDESVRGRGLEHFLTNRDVRLICQDLAIYRSNVNSVRHEIERDKESQEWLGKQANSFRKKSGLNVNCDNEFSRDLTRVVKEIERARRGLRLRSEEKWTRPIGVFSPPFRGHNKIVQARELDSWFQVRLGVVFRADMPKDPFPRRRDERGPSLRTIARLIVLFLVCAELAEEKEGQISLKHNKRLITVDGVLQQLRGASIDRKSTV